MSYYVMYKKHYHHQSVCPLNISKFRAVIIGFAFRLENHKMGTSSLFPTPPEVITMKTINDSHEHVKIYKGRNKLFFLGLGLGRRIELYQPTKSIRYRTHVQYQQQSSSFLLLVCWQMHKISITIKLHQLTQRDKDSIEMSQCQCQQNDVKNDKFYLIFQ